MVLTNHSPGDHSPHTDPLLKKRLAGSRHPSQGHIVLGNAITPSEAQMLFRATLFLLLAVPLSAHNGAVAIAVPVS